jgi:Penicillin binding protein transpeptidase domain
MELNKYKNMKGFSLIALSLLLAGCACPWTQSHTKAYPHNSAIQQIADSAADAAQKSLHPKRVAIVIAEPRTGRILAISGTGSNRAEAAVSRMYEPGSTFKPVVAVAALQTGAITPKTKINCENGAFKVEGTRHHPLLRCDSGGYGNGEGSLEFFTNFQSSWVRIPPALFLDIPERLFDPKRFQKDGGGAGFSKERRNRNRGLSVEDCDRIVTFFLFPSLSRFL